MTRSKPRIILASVLFVYMVTQLVMPKLGLSLILNFDTSCYSGAISFIERANSPNASCGTSDPRFVGFPFVINFSYNHRFQKLISLVLDSLPAITAVVLLRRMAQTRSRPEKQSDAKPLISK